MQIKATLLLKTEHRLYLFFTIAVVSDLLVYTLVFVVKTVVFAPVGIASEKVTHLILVKAQRAGILLGIFVVYVELAALTARRLFRGVLGKIKSHITLRRKL